MHILAVGDSYLGAAVFAEAFAPLESDHKIEYLQLDETLVFEASTPSELVIREHTGTPAQLIAHMASVQVLVVHGAPVTDEVLDASALLRLICCARGGPANVDVEAASKRGIPVATTPGKNAEAVADQTIAFLVMLARRLPAAQRFILSGGRTQSTFDGAEFFGHDLGGHVLGLIGYGHVGQRVATRANAFGMDVIVFDPHVELGPNEPVQQVSMLDDLLQRADFVSLHARATPETENMFDASVFEAMKPGSYFVNTARESLVDEEALDAALASGHLRGAALDVVRERREGGPHPLLRHENLVLTPHIGGATYETLLRGARMLANEIARFDDNAPLLNVTNRLMLSA